MRLFVGQILFATAIIGIVIVVKHAGGYPEYVLPSGSTIANYVRANWPDLLLLGGYTFLYSCVGLAIALVVASMTAVATMRSRRLTDGALAFGIAWQSYPIVALAPLLFVMFGDGQITRIIIIGSFAYFPAFLAFLAIGSRRVEALESFFEQVERWPRGGRFLVRLNHSGKTVESAVIGSAALALVGAVVAEFLGANYGIGYLIRTGQYSHHTEVMIAAIITIGLFSAFYFAAIQAAVRAALPGSTR
ncbi:MAG TPA: ABC transporter permease subunit [Xanthobacteraceae bacterium]|nr:ABC transporter permease subunit [Xanthobacteraceae bacterium]